MCVRARSVREKGRETGAQRETEAQGEMGDTRRETCTQRTGSKGEVTGKLPPPAAEANSWRIAWLAMRPGIQGLE